MLYLAMVFLPGGSSAVPAQSIARPNSVFILMEDSNYHLLSKMPNIRTRLV